MAYKFGKGWWGDPRGHRIAALKRHINHSCRRKIQNAIDGDTFKVRRAVAGSQYIRVAGYDAPERGQFGYLSAKNKLAKLEGKNVTIQPVGKSYGRTVADVIYKGKKWP